MTAPKDDFPMPARAKVEAALATIDDDRTTADWNEIEEAARWALHVYYARKVHTKYGEGVTDGEG